MQYLLDVFYSHFSCPLQFFPASRLQYSLDVSSHALERSGSKDPLRCPTGSNQHINSRVFSRGCYCCSHIAVGNQSYHGSGASDLFHELFVPGPVEHDHRNFLHGSIQCFRYGLKVFCRRLPYIYGLSRRGAYRKLVHVHIGDGEKGTLLSDRDHGERVGTTRGNNRRPLEGIYGDVHVRALCSPDFFSNVEHGAVVFITLSYYHPSPEVHGVEGFSHCPYRNHICPDHVAPPHDPCCCHGGNFGDPHRFECEIPIQHLSPLPVFPLPPQGDESLSPTGS